jgi:YD repeat-containing protein
MPPNEKGESAIVDSTGNAIGYVDAQGVMWEIIYDQNRRPIGKRRIQQPNQ